MAISKTRKAKPASKKTSAPAKKTVASKRPVKKGARTERERPVKKASRTERPAKKVTRQRPEARTPKKAKAAPVATSQVALTYVTTITGKSIKSTPTAFVVDGVEILKAQVVAVVNKTIYYRTTQILGELASSEIVKNQLCLTLASDDTVVVFDNSAIAITSGGAAEEAELDEEEGEDTDEEEDGEEDGEDEDGDADEDGEEDGDEDEDEDGEDEDADEDEDEEGEEDGDEDGDDDEDFSF